MADTYSRKPSLDDARARVARAAKHIADLEERIAAIWLHTARAIPGSHPDSIAARLSQPVPEIVPILISEAVHNLRAALDYLIFELSFLDSGQITERTQFPIESTPKGWEKRCRDWLRDLSDVHKAAIKRLQPFEGCAWTALLRDISNPDKHRHLTVVDQRMANKVGLAVRFGDDDRFHFAVKADPSRPNASMDVQSRGMLFDDAALPKDRLMIMETLHLLQQQVADVIKAFDPDFE